MSSPDAPQGRNPRTMWQSYKSLPHRTRLIFGLAVGITGAVGLAVADKLQEMFPADRQEAEASQAGILNPVAAPHQEKKK